MHSETVQEDLGAPITQRVFEVANISGRAFEKATSRDHEELIEHAVSIVSKISRSFQGVSDTSVSDQKPKLLLQGAELS